MYKLHQSYKCIAGYLSLVTYYLLLPQRVLAQFEVKPPNLSEMNKTKWADLKAFGSAIPDILFTLVGVLFISAIIYGGYIYLTAQGNEEKEALAKKVFTYAIIGLVVSVLAYAIIKFIISRLLGYNV